MDIGGILILYSVVGGARGVVGGARGVGCILILYIVVDVARGVVGVAREVVGGARDVVGVARGVVDGARGIVGGARGVVKSAGKVNNVEYANALIKTDLIRNIRCEKLWIPRGLYLIIVFALQLHILLKILNCHRLE